MDNFSNMVLLNSIYFYRYLKHKEHYSSAWRGTSFPVSSIARSRGSYNQKFVSLTWIMIEDIYLATVSNDDINLGTILRSLLNVLWGSQPNRVSRVVLTSRIKQKPDQSCAQCPCHQEPCQKQPTNKMWVKKFQKFQNQTTYMAAIKPASSNGSNKL